MEGDYLSSLASDSESFDGLLEIEESRRQREESRRQRESRRERNQSDEEFASLTKKIRRGKEAWLAKQKQLARSPKPGKKSGPTLVILSDDANTQEKKEQPLASPCLKAAPRPLASPSLKAAPRPRAEPEAALRPGAEPEAATRPRAAKALSHRAQTPDHPSSVVRYSNTAPSRTRVTAAEPPTLGHARSDSHRKKTSSSGRYATPKKQKPQLWNTVSNPNKYVMTYTMRPRQSYMNSITGHKGEFVVNEMLERELAGTGLKPCWVNRTEETRLPYDVVVLDETNTEVMFIEVKGSQRENNQFYLSAQELDMAIKEGDRYFIYYVSNLAKEPTLRIIRNPYRAIKDKELSLLCTITDTEKNKY